MQYAIELFFDEEMEKKLFRYAERIAEEKLSTKYLEWKTRPHITLACFNDVDEQVCVQRLKLFAEKLKLMILVLLQLMSIFLLICDIVFL